MGGTILGVLIITPFFSGDSFIVVLLMCIKTVHSQKFINNYCATTKLKILYLQRSHEKTNYFTSPKLKTNY